MSMGRTTGGRSGAVWSYLSAVLFGCLIVGIPLMWLVPLGIRARTRNPWTRAHATAVTNFGLTAGIALLGALVVSVLVFGVSSDDLYTTPVSASPLLSLAFLYVVVGLVALVVGAFHAGSGRRFDVVQAISLRLLR